MTRNADVWRGRTEWRGRCDWCVPVVRVVESGTEITDAWGSSVECCRMSASASSD